MKFGAFNAIALTALITGLLFIFPAFAQQPQTAPHTDPQRQIAPPTTPKPQETGDLVRLVNPLTGSDKTESGNIPAIIGRIIRAVLGIVGSLALLVFIYGGLIWMTAAGNEERITQGKNTLIWAVLGLIVIFTSYVVLKFIINAM